MLIISDLTLPKKSESKKLKRKGIRGGKVAEKTAGGFSLCRCVNLIPPHPKCLILKVKVKVPKNKQTKEKLNAKLK